jgi:hypothetical protein
MRGRLPLVISLVALVVAVTGFTGLGEAARDALPRASFANNAHRVDGIHASRRARAGYLFPLGRNRKFPASVIGTGPAGPPGVSALEIVTLASASDSSTPKTATVTCPAGKKVVAGGARATGAAATEVAVSESYPSSATQWTTLAREINAVGSPWMLTTYALCAIVR